MRVALLLLLASCDDLWNLEHISQRDAAVVHDMAVERDTGFDPDIDCPGDYDLVLHPGSRYRVTANSFAAWDTMDDCADDSDGPTHLAVADTTEEMTAFHDSLIAKGSGRWWLGVVQPAAGITLPGDGWLWLTGEPAPATMWSGGEPNDSDGLEADHVEQFALIQDNRDGLIDLAGAFGNRGLCECDGKRMSDDARTALDQSRP